MQYREAVDVDPDTGEMVSGWERCRIGLRTCITTELGERVERRDFGSVAPRLIDEPQNAATMLDFIIGVAEAIEPRDRRGYVYGEPCYALERVRVDFSQPGRGSISLEGQYLPFGHLNSAERATRREVVFVF